MITFIIFSCYKYIHILAGPLHYVFRRLNGVHYVHVLLCQFYTSLVTATNILWWLIFNKVCKLVNVYIMMYNCFNPVSTTHHIYVAIMWLRPKWRDFQIRRDVLCSCHFYMSDLNYGQSYNTSLIDSRIIEYTWHNR